MKTNKRTLAMLTAGLLALTPCFTAGMLTAEATDSTTLTIVDSDSTAHTYNAYQIITGTTDTDGKLKNLAIGNGITQANLITAVNAVLTTDPLASTASIDDIAVKIATIASNSDNAAALAKEIAKYKVTANANGLTQGTEANADKYSNTTLTNGWYLILDETSTLTAPTTNDSDTVRSANILQLTQDTEINTKHSLPTLDKVIIESSTEKEANSAAIGDTVTYNIKLKVPDVRGYDKYYYVVEDTLSSGLTYNNDLAVTVAGSSVTEDTDGVGDTVTTGDFYVTNSGTSIKVVFKDAVNYFKDKNVDDPIVISYTATLNNNAVIGDTGNPNTAKLKYSNDPSATGTGTNESGKPDEPGNSAPTGETPEDTVTTYTTAIQVNKVDQSNQILKGAVFTLTSSDFNEVKVVSGYHFVEDSSGTYYKLKDGSYTTTAPEGAYSAASLYDETDYNKKFKKVYITSGTNDTLIEKSGSGSYAVEAQVDENGCIRFEGLKPGTYTLHEAQAPNGYNPASDVKITITATETSGTINAPSSWTGSNATYSTSNNAFGVTVVNRFGATLPSTGGIGTKLFYLFGGMLVVGSSVVLITKKRMSADEK